jgi:FkbM family methyltransferase
VFRQLKHALRGSRFFAAAYRATLLTWRPYREWNERVSRQLVTTPFGFQLVASTTDGSNSAMLRGDFENEEVDILRKHLELADCFVDVGANVGLYTFNARQLGKAVIAVEPQRRNLECLYAGLVANNWMDVEVIPMGLADHAGLVRLYGETGPSASMVEGWGGFSPAYSQLMPVTTLDSLLGERVNGRKTVIKIDVEGAEWIVLSGARKALRLAPQPTWMVEICLEKFHPGGTNPNYQATFDLFWQAGYAAYTAELEPRKVTSEDVRAWVAQNRCGLDLFNFVFVPASLEMG